MFKNKYKCLLRIRDEYQIAWEVVIKLFTEIMRISIKKTRAKGNYRKMNCTHSCRLREIDELLKSQLIF